MSIFHFVFLVVVAGCLAVGFSKIPRGKEAIIGTMVAFVLVFTFVGWLALRYERGHPADWDSLAAIQLETLVGIDLAKAPSISEIVDMDAPALDDICVQANREAALLAFHEAARAINDGTEDRSLEPRSHVYSKWHPIVVVQPDYGFFSVLDRGRAEWPDFSSDKRAQQARFADSLGTYDIDIVNTVVADIPGAVAGATNPHSAKMFQKTSQKTIEILENSSENSALLNLCEQRSG